MSYDVIVKSGLLFRSQQVSVSNSKIEQIGSKSKLKQKKLKRLTGVSFCAAYTIQEDPAPCSNSFPTCE